MNYLPFIPENQVFWSLESYNKPLTNNTTTDILIVGGGMAGLTAAQKFKALGCDVVLIEKNYCGSGASGKSSGFITPDSELSLHDLVQEYGPVGAQALWDFIVSGVDTIRTNIESYNLSCDYQQQDTLVVASSAHDFEKDIISEHRARIQLGYQSTLHIPQDLQQSIGTDSYHGGVSYTKTFGINGYQYCQTMKKILESKGVKIYEETPAIKIEYQKVITPQATIKAKHIILCTDHATTNFKLLETMLYHAQTFLMISAPLSSKQIAQIFPQQLYMVWDTDLIYNYYRITGDNRLLLGGASLWYTYARQEKYNNHHVVKKLCDYFLQKFPEIEIQFEYVWPGLIGISKDLFPLAGHDKENSSLYYVTAAAGLPWAAALGNYSAERIINNNQFFDHYFSPYRSATLGAFTQKILGKPLTFALSNFLKVGSV